MRWNTGTEGRVGLTKEEEAQSEKHAEFADESLKKEKSVTHDSFDF